MKDVYCEDGSQACKAGRELSERSDLLLIIYYLLSVTHLIADWDWRPEAKGQMFYHKSDYDYS